jgi:hypothetical protein
MSASLAADPSRRVTGKDHGVISNRTQRTWLDDEGILHAEARPGAEQTLEDAEACVAFMWEVAGQRRRAILIDLRHAKAMDRASRAYYARPATARNQLAVALLVDSPLSRVLGNFYLGLSKPLTRTQLFTSEAAALAWLRPFRE